MKDKTLDCSDLDRVLGKPIEGARLKDPIGNLDIKRWAQAMRYPNALHYKMRLPQKAILGASLRRSRSALPATMGTVLRRPVSDVFPNRICCSAAMNGGSMDRASSAAT